MAAAALFVAAMATLGGGFGFAFLASQQSPLAAAEGFALVGLALVLGVLAARVLGFRWGDKEERR